MSVIMEPVSFKRSTVYSPPHQFAVKHPVTHIREHSPIEFLIENNGHAFIDLRKTCLHVKCKIVQPNGEPVSSNDKVAFSTYLCKVSGDMLKFIFRINWFQVLIISPFKGMLDGLCNYSEDCKESQQQSQLYYKDTAGYMDSSDPILGGNFGLTQRWG